MYWFIAVLIAVFSPSVLTLVPYLTLPELGSQLATGVVVLLLLGLVGIYLRVADIFKDLEEDRVTSYWKKYATPDYEAILVGEEFEHHPETPVSPWQRVRTRFRSFVNKLSHPG